MTYRKPEINKIAEASLAICLDNSLLKSASGADIANPHRQTVPAYAVDED